MSIHKVKFRCVNPECKNIWIENAPEDIDYVKIPNACCPECGSDKLKLSLYNDVVANFDDIDDNVA